MLAGLALTGAVAWLTANTAFGQIFYNHVLTANGTTALAPNILGWAAFLAPLGLTLLLSFRLQKMSFGAVQASYWAITALMGVQLAMILLIYTGASIATTFFVAAAMFGGMSLYGYTTGRDLTGMGSFLMMGLFGIILAGLVNMFTQSGMFQFVISAIGVVVFAGLTAYDTQRLKAEYLYVAMDGETAERSAIIGALQLYLNFINLFTLLLQLLGQREE